jgi:hypothetical protein
MGCDKIVTVRSGMRATEIGGVAGILGQGLEMAEGVSAVAPEAAEAVKGDPAQARREANQAIDQAKQYQRQHRHGR